MSQVSQVFLSHAEEDSTVVVALAGALEHAGFATWYFERDSVPGPPYLDQVYQAIQQCDALLLVVSQDSIRSHQVNAEVVLAFETQKPIVPVLGGITHKEFQERKPVWRLAIGAATFVTIPPGGVDAILDRIVAGTKKLGLRSAPAEQLSDRASPVVSPPSSPGGAVECSLFAPPQTAGDGSALVHAWLHTADQANDIAKSSADFDGAAQARSRMALTPALTAGSPMRLALTVGNMSVRSLSTRLTWQGGPDALVFRVVRSENDAAGVRPELVEVGELSVFQGDLLLGTLKFKLRVSSDGTVTPQDRVPARMRKAFLCYAAQDRAEVQRRAKMLSLVGLESFMDVTSLSAGDAWERQITRAIDEADVFVLFWSAAAKVSNWVEREWRYALATKPFESILPIALETPMPPPPAELAHIHFSPSLAYFG